MIQLEQELASKKSEMKDMKERIDEDEKKKNVYETLLYIRKKDMSYEFFETNQESVESDLLNLVSLHEALQETSIECLSKSMYGKNLSSLVKISSKLVRKLKNETLRVKKPADNAIFSTLNKVWNILIDNADLRLKINDYTEGLIMNTSKKLDQYYRDR
jgi:hypothetical protein